MEVKRKLRAFQCVLVVQAIRPDRLQSAMANFACQALSLNSLDPDAINLARLYEKESSCNQPILILMSPGTDPSQVFFLIKFWLISASSHPQPLLSLVLSLPFFHCLNTSPCSLRIYENWLQKWLVNKTLSRLLWVKARYIHSFV
jgi:hypothetical protein